MYYFTINYYVNSIHLLLKQRTYLFKGVPIREACLGVMGVLGVLGVRGVLGVTDLGLRLKSKFMGSNKSPLPRVASMSSEILTKRHFYMKHDIIPPTF